MVTEKLSTEDKEGANQAKLGKRIWDRDRGECTGKVLGLGERVWYVKKPKGDQWSTASMTIKDTDFGKISRGYWPA